MALVCHLLEHSTIDVFFILVSVSIEVVSEREGAFTVTCTATGEFSSSSLTGPGLGEALQLQAEEIAGQNIYSVTSDTLFGRSNGDTYTCTTTNDASSKVSSVVLAGTIMMLLQSLIS